MTEAIDADAIINVQDVCQDGIKTLLAIKLLLKYPRVEFFYYFCANY
jgi:hypothetical protein